MARFTTPKIGSVNRGRSKKRILIYTAVSALMVMVYRNSRWSSESYESGKPGPFQTVKAPTVPPVLPDEIGYIVRTGFEVKGRLKAGLDTWMKMISPDQLVLFSDRDSMLDGFVLQDAIKQVPAWAEKIKSDPKFDYYRQVQKLNSDYSADLAQFDRNDAWRFDAIKQVASFYLGVPQLRTRATFRWFIVADDDTYVYPRSLEKVLSGFDHRERLILGNLWRESNGDEYMHGGSGIIISIAAVEALFDLNPEDLEDMMKTVGDIGDQHIANYLRKVGATLERTAVQSFNAGHIDGLYFAPEWYCNVSATWHHLNPTEMADTHAQMKHMNENGAVHFYDIVETHSFAATGQLALNEDYSFVSCNVNSRYPEQCLVVKNEGHEFQKLDAEACRDMCTRGTILRFCAAWTWDVKLKSCYLSKGFSFTEQNTGISGLNIALIKRWRKGCA